MSSDLLHEFGVQEDSKLFRDDRGTSQAAADEFEDDFGAFEEPEVTGKKSATFAKPSQNQGRPMAFSEIRATTKQQLSNSKDHIQPPEFASEDHDMLYQDDWGDFAGETVLFDADQAIAEEVKPVNLSGTSSSQAKTTKVMQAFLFPIDQPKVTTCSPVSVPQPTADDHDNEETDLWELMCNKAGSMVAPLTSTMAVSKPAVEPSVKQTSTVDRTVRGPPPTNIPPPSVLLSLTAHYFQILLSEIRQSVTSHGTSLGAPKLLEEPQVNRIEKSLASARAGARIFAGRKVRWKRDLILSQSMKIGQASGKATGMKLTGVDKSESRREDQEAAEVLAVWRKQMGSLRSILFTVNNRHNGNSLTLPDVSEMMPIRLMKPSEGVVIAPKSCFLCGIKRDERVAKIDVDVEDSFGEWWCEHWGHVDCVIFWESHKDLLPRR